MEIKWMVIFQLILDFWLGAIVIWLLWRGEPILGMKAANKTNREELRREMARWETTARELVANMKCRLTDLESLAEEIDRAEIRASETLAQTERIEAGWSSDLNGHVTALSFLRQGMMPNEVASRTGLPLDELRLIQALSPEGRKTS
jgi:hypothetical protein